MSNHYHLVLKACPDQLEDLSDDDIMDRWCALFKGPLLIQRYRDGEDLEAFERATISDIVNVWRSRLFSISWFMRCLNQPIARQANLEDECSGKFWESRFTSQVLKSEEALLSGMAYVDLNPVRSGMAETPDEGIRRYKFEGINSKGHTLVYIKSIHHRQHDTIARPTRRTAPLNGPHAIGNDRV
jgi:hypothetical protein